MKIADVELAYLDVPFTPHTNEHMQYWLPHWRIVQVCRITLDNGVTGWGETIPNYTWAGVPGDIEEQIVGREAGDLLWEDGLGAGVQMALFDAVGPEGMSVPGGGPSYAGDDPIASPCHEWQHSIGEILTALLDAGLRLTSFAEHPATLYKQFPGMTRGDDGLWRLPFDEDLLPLTFELTATR